MTGERRVLGWGPFVIVSKPKLRTLNAVRRTRGKFSYVSSEGELTPELPIATYDSPHHAWSSTHVALVITHKSHPERRFAVEFSGENVRIIPNPSVPLENASNAMVLARRYGEQGLRFLWSEEGVHLLAAFRFSHVLVEPSLADFSKLGIASCLLSSPVPSQFNSVRRATLNGDNTYHPDYFSVMKARD